MIRGVGGCELFRDDADRADFLGRLDHLIPQLGFVCMAWALMPNHVHLVLRTGPVGLSVLMAKLETGFAQRFNRRHGRAGHLVQNRFRSLLIEDDAYLAAVIAYVLRNPLAANLCSAASLLHFAWCGLGAVFGAREPRPFESVGATLAAFGGSPQLLWEAILRNDRVPEPTQWRGFPRARRRARSSSNHAELSMLITAESRHAGVTPAALLSGSRLAAVVRARRRIAARATLALGVRTSEVARLLGVSRQAVGAMVEREGLPGDIPSSLT